jgi:alcohol dehydrogenase
VLQVGSVAQPQQPPAQGMLVIRVVAAALNPVDFKQLRNDQPDALVPKPRTLGFDVSGVVVAAGEGSGFDIGDAVYGMLPLVGSPWGALSEFTVAEAKCFAKAPRTIPLEQAAALPLVSLTVMQVFEQAGLLPGEDRKEKTILIQAAAGGVGSFAVQYARNVLGFGHVFGTCSAPNESLVRELGATATIDYTKTSFEKVAREARPTPALHASAHNGARPSCTGGS